MANNQNIKYKLVGVLNILDLIPEFVYPVFTDGGKYYLQNCFDLLTIDSFEPIINEKYITYIKPLNKYDVDLSNIKKYYVQGDDVLIGYQSNEKQLFLGSVNEFNQTYKEGKIETNYFMEIEVDDFVSKTEDKQLKR